MYVFLVNFRSCMEELSVCNWENSHKFGNLCFHVCNASITMKSLTEIVLAIMK